tara:strand:+ start:485 stop:1186 length:702 start_codon:yes stop_codon:yes gene_type:complete
MSEEQLQEATPTADVSELDLLRSSIEALERKNHELIGKLKKAKSVPDGVNVQELMDFKAKAEQEQLESQGKYSEALQAREQQFRENSAKKDERIAELEARVRDLELTAPAVSALSDVVHDPDLVMRNFLKDKEIQQGNNGPVVVDGYERIPVADWARNNVPDWVQKAPKPQGGGAPAARSASSGGLDPDLLRELTTGGINRGINQKVLGRVYQLHPENWQDYKAEAERRLRER